MSEPTFREKYEWAINNIDVPGFCIEPDEIERLYREAHPKPVTADDVLREFGFDAEFYGPKDGVRRMGAEIADLRNAAREDEDEAWIEGLGGRYFAEEMREGENECEQLERMVRAAYRERHNR